jgi:ABC-2 type transport system ATP-binding protein
VLFRSDRVLSTIQANSLVNSAEIQGNQIVISARNGSKVLPALISSFEEYSVPMISISIHTPSLEDVFIYLTGSKLDEGTGGDTKPITGRRSS